MARAPAGPTRASGAAWNASRRPRQRQRQRGWPGTGGGPGTGGRVPAAGGSLPLLREVSFRTRISVLVGAAVAVAVAMAALVSYGPSAASSSSRPIPICKARSNLVPSLVRFVAPGQLNPSPS